MESDPKFPMDLHPTMKIFFWGAVDKLRGAGVPDVHPEGAPSIQAFTEIIHAILLQENLSDEEQDAMHLKLERTMRPFLLFGGESANIWANTTSDATNPSRSWQDQHHTVKRWTSHKFIWGELEEVVS